MVSNGGNAESFLLAPVDYNYSDYSLIALSNLTIDVGKRSDQNVEEQVKFAAGSGQNPDSMAITMMVCGPQGEDTMQAYEQCFREKIIYVPGMGGGVRRKAYMGGELNVTRESPARYRKINLAENELWFHHGVLDLDSGNIVDDKNKFQETLPDILFMCIEKQKLLQLCDLFPQTAENIKERARERRVRFMQQKNTNSIRFDEKKE